MTTRRPEHSVSYKQAAKMLRVRDTYNLWDREKDEKTKAELYQRARDEGVPRQVAHNFVQNDQQDCLNRDYQGPRYYHADGELGRLRLKTPEEFALDERRRPQPEPRGSDDA